MNVFVWGLKSFLRILTRVFKDFTVVGEDVRFGIYAVKNVGEGAAESIIETRGKYGRFESIF